MFDNAFDDNDDQDDEDVEDHVDFDECQSKNKGKKADSTTETLANNFARNNSGEGKTLMELEQRQSFVLSMICMLTGTYPHPTFTFIITGEKAGNMH